VVECGRRNRVYIIAEAGVNHNGSVDLAKRLVDAAKDANADAVKFQTFKTDKVISLKAPKAQYQKSVASLDESQFEMVKRLELNEVEHEELATYCLKNGIEFISSPFDLESVDLLAKKIGVRKIKIGSGEITNAPLLLKSAQTGLDIILSTGMSTLGEIETALMVLAFGYISGGKDSPSIEVFKEAYLSREGQEALKTKVTLLHCNTEYPTPITDVNLKAMDTMKKAFRLRVGYSDHTLGITIPVAAAARGAAVIEKHFTLDKGLPGPDHKASLNPVELKEMVKSIREVEIALGNGLKAPSPSEIKNIPVVRKSLIALRNIEKGEAFSEENLGFKRPGNGVSPIHYWSYLGQKASENYKKGDLI